MWYESDTSRMLPMLDLIKDSHMNILCMDGTNKPLRYNYLVLFYTNAVTRIKDILLNYIATIATHIPGKYLFVLYGTIPPGQNLFLPVENDSLVYLLNMILE